jgi:N-acetylglutamate synthase-like GNAT family acetyltransferase
MLSPIFNARDIQTHINDDYKLKEVNSSVKNTNNLVQRAFTELKDSGIIQNYDYTEESIIYKTDSGDNLAISRYAIFDDVAYLSWIWLSEELRGNDYGTKLTDQTIQHIKSYNISKIYTIPKSEPAKKIFLNHGFKDATEINSNYKVLKL